MCKSPSTPTVKSDDRSVVLGREFGTVGANESTTIIVDTIRTDVNADDVSLMVILFLAKMVVDGVFWFCV